ncbi:hypothetical protein EWM64_g1709 [Hericium alpestre]|uniref:Uncharacterized protein n=1 Tax=Hericium alpestre TaxID=135208 RepID=A0A4Z0A9T8_9AGAM|nr:hypothetical protein EWM64_g1709 [Hericium alpestre]
MSLPIHKLSAKSTKSGRDTFIFLAYGSYVRLIAGTGEDVWNLDPIVPFSDSTISQDSFADLATDVATDAQLQLCEFDASREERVEARDINCFFTRRSGKHELKVTWIIPPAWFSQVDNAGEKALPYQNDDNAILLWKALESHWTNNEFAVDVQDNYRIVRFRSLQEEDNLLPQRLPRTPGPAMDKFLRKHFAWCLRVNLEAGDISEDDDYTDDIFTSFCEDMGLTFIEDDKKKPRASPNHPGWQTDIGKEYPELELMGLTMPDDGVDI